MRPGPPRLPDDPLLRFRTARLDLVPIARTHAAAMFAILADERLHAFTGGEPPADAAALARRYEHLESRRSPDGSELWLNWVMHERTEGAPVGFVQAGVGAGYADVAWVVGTAWQGRGYASEAAAGLAEWLIRLGVAEIRAAIHPDHAASIRVAERAGLSRTARERDGEIVWARHTGE